MKTSPFKRRGPERLVNNRTNQLISFELLKILLLTFKTLNDLMTPECVTGDK